MGDGVTSPRGWRGLRARRYLPVRGRLSPGERQARYGGHGSRPDATQEHRKVDPGLFLASGRPCQSEICTEAKPPTEKAFVARALALGFAALVILIAAGAWYFLGANRPAQAAHLSIVVLPFTNLSGDPARLFRRRHNGKPHHGLSRIGDSFVIARNTAFVYKGKAMTPRRSAWSWRPLRARRLGPARPEPRPRQRAMHPRAVRAHLWAERFEEDVTDLFKLQDQVVARLPTPGL